MTHNPSAANRFFGLLACALLAVVFPVAAQQSSAAEPDAASELVSEQTAARLLFVSMQTLIHSQPFNAKLRQTIQIAGERLVGVGRYEHAGRGTGRYRYELKIPTESGGGTLLQTNDGRLVWTSRRLGEETIVQRVALSRLAEKSSDPYRLPPQNRVGGLLELLDRIGQDYRLQAVDGRLHDKPVVILRGPIRPEAKERIAERLGVAALPDYIPNRVRIAVARTGAPQWMVHRIEYLHEDEGAEAETLLSVLEIYDIAFGEEQKPMRFHFDAEHMDVEIEDITQRYVESSPALARQTLGPLYK